MTTRSTTIAIWFCGGGSDTAVVVASANRPAASPVSWKLTVHSEPVAPPRIAFASATSPPAMIAGASRYRFPASSSYTTS